MAVVAIKTAERRQERDAAPHAARLKGERETETSWPDLGPTALHKKKREDAVNKSSNPKLSLRATTGNLAVDAQVVTPNKQDRTDNPIFHGLL